MKYLLALISIGSAVGYSVPYYPYGPYNRYPQNSNSQDNSYDGLFAGASSQAIAAYSEVVQNFSQSLADIKTALERWAKTYGLEQQYQKFLEESEKENSDFKKEVNSLLPKLSQYFVQYTKIGDDKRQSIKNIMERTSALSKTLDDKQKTIAEFIKNTYMPSTADGVSGTQGSSNGAYPGNIGLFPGMGGLFQSGPQIYPNSGLYAGSNGGFLGNNGGFPQTNGGFPARNGGLSANAGSFPVYGEVNGVNPTIINGYPGSLEGYKNAGYKRDTGMFSGYNGAYPRVTGRNSGHSGVFTGTVENYPNGNNVNTLGGYSGGYEGNGNRLQGQNEGIYGYSGGFSNSNVASRHVPGVFNFGSDILQANEQFRP